MNTDSSFLLFFVLFFFFFSDAENRDHKEYKPSQSRDKYYATMQETTSKILWHRCKNNSDNILRFDAEEKKKKNMLWKRSSPMTILDKFSTFFFKADRAILRCGGILIDKNWSNHVTFRYSYSGNILSSDPDPSQALPLGTYMPSSRRCLLSSFHIFAAGCASALATAHCS